ncbi:MAG: CRISPR-associated protein Cas6 [Cytophagaceae bacterium]|nr:CRISPR-associated protein Cas6 [Cytophagaceae bacterium]MDW8455246.1 CRISPR-associated endoribonuclease Cas6 [Cytophagaceae bacterium]
MRVRIIFGLINKGGYVPFHHQYILADFIEKLLHKHHDELDTREAQYNFSGLKGQTRIGKDGLHFYSSKITLVLSGPDKNFIDFFLRKLFLLNKIEIGKLHLKPMHVEKESLPAPSQEMKYLCLSPMVIMSHDNLNDSKKFVNPSSDLFSDLMYECLMNRMEQHGYSPEQLADFYKFQIVPDEKYLSNIKNDDKKFARVFPVYINGDKYEVRGYTFPFTLYADVHVQNFVLENGIGYLTKKGFGMLDIANSDPNARVTPYDIPAE